MSLREFAARIRERNAELDQRFVDFLQRHMDLVLAVGVLGLVIWAGATDRPAYMLEIAIVGAVSFYAGFVEALGLGAILIGWGIAERVMGSPGLDISSGMIQVVGYGCVAWLGFRHREQQGREKERIHSRLLHADSVIPWAVANEVRTSLAAVRFLLFPLDEQETPRSIRQVTDELKRLEEIFSEIERREREENEAEHR